jgi:hypothetical protein
MANLTADHNSVVEVENRSTFSIFPGDILHKKPTFVLYYSWGYYDPEA